MICKTCNKRKRVLKETRPNGTKKFKPRCRTCDLKRRGISQTFFTTTRNRFLKAQPKICSKCGFIPDILCQLEVDHINGDRTNNTPENLQVLCANCHKLKTHFDSHRLSSCKV